MDYAKKDLPIFSTSNFDDENTDMKTPKFNSGVDYLMTIGDLQRGIISAFVNDDLNSMQRGIKSLQILVLPRMSYAQKDNIRKYEVSLISINIASTTATKNPKFIEAHNQDTANKLSRWYEELNIIIHNLGLIMPDKKGEDETF